MCQPYKHEELRLEQDMSWRCKKCEHTWSKYELPMVVLSEGK